MRRWGWKQGLNLHMHKMPELFLFEDGSVRSGKTLSIGYGFTRWMVSCFDGPTNFLLAAPTLTQVREVMFEAMYEACDFWGIPYVPYRSDRKHAQVGPFKVYGFSADSKNDQRRVRGLTLGGAWLDEASDIQEEFLDTVVERCSLGERKIVISTNPKGPYHWLKLRFIDQRSEDVKRIAWRLEDNPYGVDAEYIETLKRTLQGATLRRDVYGEWTAESGLVYPNFTPNAPPLGEPAEYHLAMDFASSSVSHALLVGVWPGGRQAWVVDEWRWDGRVRGELTPDEQARRIRVWLDGVQPKRVFVDPAASHMRVALSRVGLAAVAAENEVLAGIYAVQAWLAEERLGVSPRCVETVRELGGYAWDPKAMETGEDKPVKANDHACDALRYWVYSMQKRSRVVRGFYE